MATTFKTDAAKSRSDFRRFIEPALHRLGFRDVVSVEKHNSALEKLLDRASVDAVATYCDRLFAFASRVIQVKPYGGNYDGFSLRNKRVSGMETELQKLQRAIKQELIRPQIHVQAFVDEDEQVATVAFAHTRPLVEFIMSHNVKTITANDGTEFKFARWKDLENVGITVKFYTFPTTETKKASRR